MSITEKRFNTGNGPHLIKLLETAGKKMVFLTHLNPDGDALGSTLGLLNLFRKMKHECFVVSPNDYPEFLKWMPGSERILVLKHMRDTVLKIIREADIIFAIDFNELKRVKELKEAIDISPAFKILIDHHPDPVMNVDFMMSDTSVSSTAELVFQFIHNMGLKQWIDKEVATCLFTGIMTDTGCFSYNSSKRETWVTVAELLDYGINKDDIYSLVYDNYSEHRMHLLGYSLNCKMEVLPEFRTGYMVLSKNDLTQYHFEPGDSEGFVNYPLSIRGICFSALFTEKDNYVRVSFRSKGNFAVNDFSRMHFNGGGHKNAAGGEIYTSLEEAVAVFKALLPDYKTKLMENED